MDNDYRQRLRDAYADRVLDDLADIASRSDSEYTRFHALKLLGQHHGLDHVLHQLMNLSHHAKSDWVRLQIASLVGHHLQLFTPFNEHRNAPPSLITLPEPAPPPAIAPAPINSVIPAPEPESHRKEIRHSRESGNLPRATSHVPPQDSRVRGNGVESLPFPFRHSHPQAGIPPYYPQPAATTIVAEPFNPSRPFKTNEAANTPTIAAIAQALHLAKSTTHPPDP